MLKPKQVKFFKQHRGRKTGRIGINVKKHFGHFILYSQENIWLNSKQIEATRRTLIRSLKKEGKLWVLVFPTKPITARTPESRMGSGKGIVQYWVTRVKPGTKLFSISGISESVAKKVFKLATQKLPIKTKVCINLTQS